MASTSPTSSPSPTSRTPSDGRNHLPQPPRVPPGPRGASGPVIIDLETTGIERSSRIVSAGVLVDDHVFILFLRSDHAGIRNLTVDRLRWALEPLANPCLTLVLP